MTLRAKNPKHATLRKPKILIYGKPGVGKTMGVLDFPKVYYIDCEGGASLDHYTDRLQASGGVYMGVDDGANDIDVVAKEIMALATTNHEYLTVAIDSYSKLFLTAIQIEHDRMVSEGRDMSKTFGAEKKPAIARTRQIVRWLDKLDMNVILVCHEKSLWKNGEQVGETFDAYDKLEYDLDLVMQIVKQGKSRKARICKSRLLQFDESEFIEWSFDSFADRYGRGIIEAASVPVALASDEQVEHITTLAEMLKLDDAARIKWWEKAGVQSWSEMTGDTIQKCINALESKLPNNKEGKQ